jgi:hypothetical protein
MPFGQSFYCFTGKKQLMQHGGLRFDIPKERGFIHAPYKLLGQLYRLEYIENDGIIARHKPTLP